MKLLKHILSILLLIILQISFTNSFASITLNEELCVGDKEFSENLISEFLQSDFKENHIFEASFYDNVSCSSISCCTVYAELVEAWEKIENAGFGELRKNVDALKYVDNLKNTAKFGDDGVESFNGIKSIWNRRFPETINTDGTSRLIKHHAVEQQVLNKYPGIITKREMHSLGNLRGVPKEINSNLHLRQIRKQWDDFHDSFDDIGAVPNKQQLLEKAKEIDDLFGNQFFPPVR